jgi:chromatin-remodeling ATPase INO80
MFQSRQKVDNLMNLVMQFRKVCNHPELFERRPNKSPLLFSQVYNYHINVPLKYGEIRTVISNVKSPI